MLTLATTRGDLFAYVTAVPLLADASGTSVAYLSSLRDVSVYDTGEKVFKVVNCELEPELMALGAFHVAVSLNQRALYFRTVGAPPHAKVNEVDYPAAVQALALNDRVAAALCGGRVRLHCIESEDDPRSEKDMTLPSAKEAARFGRQPPNVTCIAMTQEFLIYGTASGAVCYFYLQARNPEVAQITLASRLP